MSRIFAMSGFFRHVSSLHLRPGTNMGFEIKPSYYNRLPYSSGTQSFNFKSTNIEIRKKLGLVTIKNFFNS